MGDNQPVNKELVRNLTKTEKSSISFEPKNVAELDMFFCCNKEKFHEIWVILTKKKYLNPQPVSFSEVVSEAIEHGLIDNKTKTIDEQKYAVRFTKRKSPKLSLPKS